jgi:prophage antirepressor-like protein
MLTTEKILVPFMEETYLTKIQSLKDPERFLFTSVDILKLCPHTNFSQARGDAQLIQGQDYVVLEKKSQPLKLWESLQNLDLIPLRSARITMVYESGFWKILMCSTKSNSALINWIASDVLPDIRRTGRYDFKKVRSQEESKTYLVKDTIANIYKIGKSQNVKNRIISMKTDNINIELEFTLDINIEKELHEKFKEKNVGGEWFNLDEQDVLYIKNYIENKNKIEEQNCLQVTGQTPSQLKKAYGRPNKSSKEILREYDPAKAMTMSLNDHLVEKEKMELKNLVVLDDLLTKTFQEMLNIGIRIIP